MPFKTVIRSYNGKNTNGSPLKNVLRASVGNQVKIVEGNRNGWTKVELRGQRGLFPTYYLGEDLIQANMQKRPGYHHELIKVIGAEKAKKYYEQLITLIKNNDPEERTAVEIIITFAGIDDLLPDIASDNYGREAYFKDNFDNMLKCLRRLLKRAKNRGSNYTFNLVKYLLEIIKGRYPGYSDRINYFISDEIGGGGVAAGPAANDAAADAAAGSAAEAAAADAAAADAIRNAITKKGDMMNILSVPPDIQIIVDRAFQKNIKVSNRQKYSYQQATLIIFPLSPQLAKNVAFYVKQIILVILQTALNNTRKSPTKKNDLIDVMNQLATFISKTRYIQLNSLYNKVVELIKISGVSAKRNIEKRDWIRQVNNLLLLLKAAEEKLELRGGGRVKVTVGKNGNKYYFKGGRRTAAPSRKKSTRTATPSRKKSTRTKVTIGRDGKKYYFKGGKRVAAPKRVRK